MITVQNLKNSLDDLQKKYETVDFIKDDPILFAHRFKYMDEKDLEIASFIASIFAFGKRQAFMQKLNIFFDLMQNKPFDYISNFNHQVCNLQGLNYRFFKESDIIQLCYVLHILYKKMTLKDLFYKAFRQNNDIFKMLQVVVDFFYSKVEGSKKNLAGFYYMLPHPKANSALKRLNMFLRWMVRQNSQVDLGVWDFINTKYLYIPLDTHVARISRNLQILKRKSNDQKAAIELTNTLKNFDPHDPVKYDFALFGQGVEEKY